MVSPKPEFNRAYIVGWLEMMLLYASASPSPQHQAAFLIASIGRLIEIERKLEKYESPHPALHPEVIEGGQ